MKEEFTIEGIAEKIYRDPKFREEIVEGYKQKIKNFGFNDGQYEIKYNNPKRCSISKGDVIATVLELSNSCGEKKLYAPHSGILEIVNSSQRFVYANQSFAYIYPFEHDFYLKHENEINKMVEDFPRIEKERQKKEALEKEKQDREKQEEIIRNQKKADQKNREKSLADEENRNLEDLDTYLAQLDISLQKKEAINIQFLQAIEKALNNLFNQKENLKSARRLEEFSKHFATAYKMSSKDPNLSQNVKNRMFSILELFCDTLGMTSKSKRDFLDEVERDITNEKNAKKIEALSTCIRDTQSLMSEQAKTPQITDLQHLEDLINDLTKTEIDQNHKELIKSQMSQFATLYKTAIKESKFPQNIKEKMRTILELFCDALKDRKKRFLAEIKQDIENEKNAKKLEELSACIVNTQSLIAEQAQTPQITDLQRFEDLINALTKTEIDQNHKDILMSQMSQFASICKTAIKDSKTPQNVKEKMHSILELFCDALDDSKKRFLAEIEQDIETENNSRKIDALSTCITDMQTLMIEQEKMPQIADLQRLEILINDLFKTDTNQEQKDLIKQQMSQFATICKMASKDSNFSQNANERMLSVLELFCDALDMSIKKKRDFLDEIEKDIETEKNSKKLDELSNCISDIQTLMIEQAKMPQIADLQRLEVLINDLSKMDTNQEQKELLKPQLSHFATVYKTASKDSNFSQNANERMLLILELFCAAIDMSDDDKNHFLAEIKQDIESEKNANKVDALSTCIGDMQTLMTEQAKMPQIADLQRLEDLINNLAKTEIDQNQKDFIKQQSVYFDALYKDCKKSKQFPTSIDSRMREIRRVFIDCLKRKPSKK